MKRILPVILAIIIFLPCLYAQNDFSGDPDCVALWRLEDGALTTDSIGSNTLTNRGMSSDTVDFKEGAASGNFNVNELYITDANLDAGFPLKNGAISSLSIGFWFNYDLSSNDYFIGKFATFQFSFGIQINSDAVVGKIGDGGNFEDLTLFSGLSSGGWYHLVFTFNNSNYAWTARLWDVDGASASSNSGTGTRAITGTVANFGIGGSGGNTNEYDGHMDEVVVFKRILTESEADKIRSGTYSYGSGTPDVNLLLLNVYAKLNFWKPEFQLPGLLRIK